jgi:bifunctional oligoribonuclease and PAP phosphatase NrnA
MSIAAESVRNLEIESVWQPVLELIENARRIILSTHENSDGDGLGSEVALCGALRQLGKEVTILNPTNIPRNYRFLPLLNEAMIFSETNEAHLEKLHDADLFVLLDTNHIGRTRGIKPHVTEMRDVGTLKVICIDHHLHPEDFADTMICLSYASATGELVYELIKSMEARYKKPLIDKTVATGLYTAIMTDTASFKLPKTTPHVHRIIAEILEAGVSPMEMYDKIFNTLNGNILQLIGYGVSHVHLLENEQLAYMPIAQSVLQETKTVLADTERMMEYMTGVPTVHIAIMMIELPDGNTKISFRSRGEIPVNEIAMRYNGGGHRNAAGCTVKLPLRDTITEVLPHATAMLRQFVAEPH